MAVSRGPSVIKITAKDDAVTDTLFLQGILVDHSAAAAMTVTDTADKAVAQMRTTTSELTGKLFFPKPFKVVGIKAAALTTGAVMYLYLA